MEQRYIPAADGHQIQTLVWQNPKAHACVHILHGMAEHGQRYDEFAQYLLSQGFTVVAHNHRGHGSSDTTELGQFALEDGWNKVLSDIDTVREQTCNPHLPYVLFGHSMGSFIAQAYLAQDSKNATALVLSGSNFQAPLLSKAAKFIGKIERSRLGKQQASKLIQFLSFGSFNQKFKPNRTEFDWLSRDAQQVDTYINDPLCGFDCHTQLWLDLFDGLIQVFEQGLAHIPHIPVYIFGGDKDPVGLMGKGLPKLAQAYKKHGQTDVTLKLYENGRHEMLNEINKQQVWQALADWMQSRVTTDSTQSSSA